MGNSIARSLICLVPMAVMVAAFGAAAAPIAIDFETDTAGLIKPNGFASSGSPQVHFSDSMDADLAVVDFGGSHALAVLLDDDSELEMKFDFIASALSLDFGNTSLANIGDTAVLTVFLGGSLVGSSVLVLNGTDAIDQTISFEGAWFDSATFKYNVAAGLTEVVDNIYVTPAVPEPRAALVFGMGALMVGAACGRRSFANAEVRAARD